MQSRMNWKVVLLVVGAIAMVVFMCHGLGQSSPTAPVLSDAPDSACDGISSPNYPTAPGTLTAQVNGQSVTHFVANQSFQLIYTGDAGDSFAPQQFGVDAYPYFDGALQSSDADSAWFSIKQQDISGVHLTATLTFPFTHPKFPNVYTKPGPYCFGVLVTYTRPDGQIAMAASYIGLVEDPANAS